MVDGIEYDLCRPTEHQPGVHRLIRHYRRTSRALPGQTVEHAMPGQLALVEVGA